MTRDNILTAALFTLVAAILGVGLWMWLTPASDSSASSDKGDATASEAPAGQTSSGDPQAERRVEIPNCPAALTLDESFRKQAADGSPTVEFRSKARMVQIEASCRTAEAKDFDRDQFLHDIYEGMKLKHKSKLQGRTPITLQDGRVRGSSIQIRDPETERLTFNNVIVRDRTILMLKVGGPVEEGTRRFNDTLLEDKVTWSE